MATLKITTIERESASLGGKIVLNNQANTGSWQINVPSGTSPNLKIGRPGQNSIIDILDDGSNKGLTVNNILQVVGNAFLNSTLTIGTGLAQTIIGSGITTNGLSVNGPSVLTGTVQVFGPVSLTGTLSISTDLLMGGNLTVGGNSTFSISPTAPTPAAGSNNTQLATTAFVQSEQKLHQIQFISNANTTLITEHISTSTSTTTFTRTGNGVGKEIMSFVFTPKKIGANVLVEVCVSGSVLNGYPAMLLFADNVCIGGDWDNNYGQYAESKTRMQFSYQFVTTSLNSILFYVHAGSMYTSDYPSNFRLNRGYSASQHLNNMARSWIKFTEYGA